MILHSKAENMYKNKVKRIQEWYIAHRLHLFPTTLLQLCSGWTRKKCYFMSYRTAEHERFTIKLSLHFIIIPLSQGPLKLQFSRRSENRCWININQDGSRFVTSLLSFYLSLTFVNLQADLDLCRTNGAARCEGVRLYHRSIASSTTKLKEQSHFLFHFFSGPKLTPIDFQGSSNEICRHNESVNLLHINHVKEALNPKSRQSYIN